MTRRFRTAGFAAVLVLVLTAGACVGSPATVPVDNRTALPGGSVWSPADVLPLAPELVKKTLPNGLTYYVRRNGNPGGRAVMFLAIASGSSNERDDQSGYAHFVEHMAFNGTTSFPENDLVKYLRSIGMDFGAEINAHTSREETQYALEMPLDNPDYFDTGLKVLKEWATEVTFDPVEVEKEKGVILEERRLGIGSGDAARTRELQGLLAGSIHADREPIGTEESIKAATAEGLKAFYKENYRPDRMAVIVVGDIDAQAVAAKIEKEFSFPAEDGTVQPRPAFPVVTTNGLGFVATFDDDFDPSVITYRKIVPYEPETVIGDYLKLLGVRVTAEAIRLRLSDLSRTGTAAWREAYFDDDYFFGRTRLYSFSLSVSTGGEAAAFAGLAAEVERLRRFGFTESEFHRTIDLYRRWLSTLNVEDDDLKSRSFAEEYVRNFMYGEPVPGVVNERVYIRSFLDSVTLEDFNAMVGSMLAADEGFVAVRAKPEVGSASVNKEAFGRLLRDARSTQLEQLVSKADEGGLFNNLPQAGSIVGEKDLGNKITELTLSNGARVLLRPTTYDFDAISFFAWSPGGYMAMPVGKQNQATFAPSLMSNAGLGTMNATRVDEVTASLNASLQWSIGEDGEVMAGKTLKKDLDAFLRLVYLTAAEPGTDAMAFNAARDKLVDQVGPYVRDPGYRFQVSWSSDLFGGNPRAGAMGASDVRSIDFAATREMVVGALANAADFTYVLVGDFDIETAKTLAARHIGAIPAGSVKAPQWEQPLVARSGGGQVSYRLSREDRASVRMVWAAPATWSWQREATIELLAQALNNRLLDALREDLGGTYVVSTRAAFSKTPVGQYSFIVQFDTNSARVDELVAKVRTEVAALVSGSFDPMYVRQIAAAARRDLDGRSRTNEFWINRMVNALTAGMDFDIPGRARETLDFVDPQAFRTLASELLVPAHEFVYIMMPE